MKYKAIYVTLIKMLVIACIAFAVSKCVSNDEIHIDKYKKQKVEIDSLSNLNIVLKKRDDELSKIIQSRNNVVDSLDDKILDTKEQIKNIKIYYGKKINNINNYSPSQLSHFFTKRYE